MSTIIQPHSNNSRNGIGILAVAVFLGGIGGGIAFPILPLLGVKLGLSGVLIGLILSANRITRLGMNPVSGHLIDRIGGKVPLVIGLFTEAVATGTFSLALRTPIPGVLLLAGRAVWGFGSSLLLVGGMTLALNLSSEQSRGRSTATVRMALSLGMPAGMLAGGVIAGNWTDDAAFLAATAAAIIGALFSWMLVPNGRHAKSKRSRSHHESINVLQRLIRGVRMVFAADRRIQIVWIVNTLVFFSLQGILLATLVLLINRRGITFPSLDIQSTAGVLMSVMILSSAGTTMLVGRVLDRTLHGQALRTAGGRLSSRVVPAIPAIIASACGFALLGLSTRLVPAVISLVLIGIGMGGVSTPLLTLLGDLTPPARRGNVIGIYQFFGDIGGSLGPIAGVELGMHIGYRPIYLGITVLFFLVVLLLLRLHSGDEGGHSSLDVRP